MSKRGLAAMWVLVVGAFLLGAWFYPRLPATVASHWNASGEVDGYMSRFWGAFLVPLIAFGLALLLTLVPSIDPLRENIATFRTYYETFAVLLMLFALFLEAFELLWNVGIRLNPNIVFPVSVGLLFLYIGFLLEHVKPNWFIGIRTPWTLSSESVWRKTHHLGALLFKALGVLTIASIALPPKYVVGVVLGGTIAVALAVTAYSYLQYERERREAR